MEIRAISLQKTHKFAPADNKISRTMAIFAISYKEIRPFFFKIATIVGKYRMLNQNVKLTLLQ